MAKALGTTPESSYQTNTYLLAPHLTGNVGLLFTTSSPTLLTARLASLTSTDYARAGTPATRAFLIPAGTVYSTGGETSEDADVPLSHSLEPELRRLGVPTSLVKGRISLQNEYEVCKEGQTLDSRQTRLLKLFGVATAEFRVELVAVWEKEVEGVRVLGGEEMEE
jgi:mRNA turnover protein 4